MNDPLRHPAEADLRRQRESVRQGLSRVQWTMGAILALALALSLAAIAQTWRAERNSAAAREATRRTQEELWRARLLQAQSERSSGRAGRRGECLAALGSAAAYRPSLELRNEAIAALALADLQPAPDHHVLPPGMRIRAIDAEGRRFAIADASGRITVGGIAPGEKAAAFDPGGGEIRTLEFSPDGRWLALREAGGAVQNWDLAGPRRAFRREFATGDPHRQSASFSPDGQVMAVAARGKSIYFLDPATGSEVRPALEFPTEPGGARFGPSGREMLVWFFDRREIEIWDWRAGRRLHTLELPAPPEIVAWNSTGTRVAAGCANGSVQLAEAASGRVTELRGHSDLVEAVAFHPQAGLLFSVSWDGTAQFWNEDTGEHLFAVADKVPLAFTRDGSRITGIDLVRQELVAWELQGTSFCRVLRGSAEAGRVWGVDVSRDGRWLAAATDGGVRLWSLPEGRPESAAAGGPVYCVAFHPDGNSLLAAGVSGLTRWSISQSGTGKNPNFQLGEPMTLNIPGDAGLMVRCGWADQGRSVIGMTRERAHVLEGADFRPRLDIRGPGNFNAFNLDPKNRWLATSTWQGAGTQVWNRQTGKLERNLGAGDSWVAFMPDGGALITGTGLEYCCWETAGWKPRWKISRTTTGVNTGPIGLDDTGSLLALARSTRLTELANPATGEVLATLTAPNSQQVYAYAFSPKGALLAVGMSGGGIQLWDIAGLRAGLAGMGLDWPFPAKPPALADLKVSWSSGPYLFLAALGAVLGAAVFYALVFRRQRQLIASYEQIENTALTRGRELVAAHAEILHSQKMKALGTLAAGIAHDFNNLLSVIRMANTSIARRVTNHEEIREDLADIEETVLQGKSVVRSMVGFSRDADAETSSCSAAEVAQDTLTLLSKPFLSGLELSVELDRGVPAAAVSRSRLAQILLNLIMNAAEAMNGRGRLRVTLTRREIEPGTQFILSPRPGTGTLELAVADDGPGIPPEVLVRIFEPFFTTKLTGSARGSGLGLSVVYAMAQHEGIGIMVDTKPGQGTCFRLLLPTA